MTFIGMGNEFGDVKEGERVPEGAYDLRCAGFTLIEEVIEGIKVVTVVQVSIDVLNPPDDVSRPSPIFHRINIVTAGDEEGKAYSKSLFARRFLHLFSISHTGDGFDPEDIPGATANNVTLTHTMNKEDPDIIYVNIRLPRLPDEQDTQTAPRGRRRSA